MVILCGNHCWPLAPLRLCTCTAGSSDVCVEVCRLQVYPQMDNGSKCERCGLAHSSVWQEARFASIDLLWSKGYNAGSALMGTTQSQMGQITHAVLLSEGLNVRLPLGVPHSLSAVSGSLGHATGHCCCSFSAWPILACLHEVAVQIGGHLSVQAAH